eukprot:CAMPEP_0195520958 /NCGR_PEP_ID=MMETSP0794_2-20130614/17683_1 /TAXON_ID=515487 /ORGANISM="Stephanopyxis turris, Strain CCMP 815" /LENGTH=284 /DNA_ID=CAMNT_0040650405 /DNA_START=15 /DNA_END=872 /DNA_ORIENTATION=+
MSKTMDTNKDRDCAFLARAALFPSRLHRDKTHDLELPALQALGKIRDVVMAKYPNAALSSVFPKHVLVVRSVTANYGELQWNGQPDLKGASFDVLPNIFSVCCSDCDALNIPSELNAFTRIVGEKSGQTGVKKEIVLCTDRLMKSDYSPEKSLDMSSLPRRSFQAVEEALAHEVTKIRDQFKFDCKDNTDDPSSTCRGLALAEIRAAAAAECYYSKEGKSVRRGSGLPRGFSLLPASVQRSILHRCINTVAMKSTERKFGNGEGSKCVAEVFDSVINPYDGKQE